MRSLIFGDSRLGKAVFANKNFVKGENIIGFSGQMMKKVELPKIVNSQEDRYVQVGKDDYLGPSGDYDDFINHSCNPNSGLKFEGNAVVLVAIKKIKKGEEITWDYSTTMDEDDWEMECMCESKNCRKRIRDFKYLKKRAQRKYIKLGIVPKYILEKLKWTKSSST